MAAVRAELVEIDAKGVARPVGEAAARMQGLEGRFAIQPSPPELLVLRRVGAAGGEEERACVLSGEIRSPGTLCEIVGFISHTGWRGELKVLEHSTSRSLYFDQGQIVGAQSTVPTERLGDVLHRHGILDEEQVKRCSDATGTGALRFGEAAVKFGFVTRERLFALAARQIEEIFYGALLVSGAMFYFLDSFGESSLSIRQKMSVPTLVRDGVRRMHETQYFRARIPTNQHVPALVPGLALPETDPSGVFAAIDGERSVMDISRWVGQSEFEVCRSLFQFIQSGHVRMKPPRLTLKARVELYNQAIALILRELDAVDQGVLVRRQLAEFGAKGQVYPALFAGVARTNDGTLDPNRIAANAARLAGAAEAEEKLGHWLYDYASYALFLARPHLDRDKDARNEGQQAFPRRISQRVKTVLGPIAPPAAGHVPEKPGK
jgi:hypothetical protein